MLGNLFLSMSLALALCTLTGANVDTGNMRDLGYAEPNWYPIVQGKAEDPVVSPPLTAFWGNLQPGSAGNPPLCKWFASEENGGRGSCKTDLSWIHSALGFTREIFNDPVVNYILRFHLNGACYRSTQVRCAHLTGFVTHKPVPSKQECLLTFNLLCTVS
jgi:hypothetical protein